MRHTPQQNGVAEKKNRTIEDMACSMLKGRGLSNKFWAEAVNTTVYILNWSPTKVVPDRTPFEAWHDRKPVVSQLKVFGCITYAHVLLKTRRSSMKKERISFLLAIAMNPKGTDFITREQVSWFCQGSMSWPLGVGMTMNRKLLQHLVGSQ